MSVTPQQMQQMLAMFKQQFPQGQQGQQGPAGFDSAPGAVMPQGINRSAGNVQGAAQLIAALMKAQKQKQIQTQLSNSQQVQGPPQGSIPAMYPSASDPPPTPSPGTLANPQGF